MVISPREVDPNKFYTVEEVAVFLDISEQTVRKHLRNYVLKGKKIGRRWHIKGAVIRKFIED
ncbi:MAG: hypothetical protein APR63_08915 [Desulfuromonas sp. SDB]|nr:MAG: hypothetical protein APR63_08915 [Desulfuromonas sp. SDB]